MLDPNPSLPAPHRGHPMYVLLRSTVLRTISETDPLFREAECWDRREAQAIVDEWCADPASRGAFIAVDACYQTCTKAILNYQVPAES